MFEVATMLNTHSFTNSDFVALSAIMMRWRKKHMKAYREAHRSENTNIEGSEDDLRGLSQRHGGINICVHEGCTLRGFLRGGVCRRHSQMEGKKRKKCSTEGCTSYAFTGLLCKKHCGHYTCKVDGCTNNAVTLKLGLCIRHGAVGRATCSYEGCNKRAYTKGLRCIRHRIRDTDIEGADLKAAAQPSTVNTEICNLADGKDTTKDARNIEVKEVPSSLQDNDDSEEADIDH